MGRSISRKTACFIIEVRDVGTSDSSQPCFCSRVFNYYTFDFLVRLPVVLDFVTFFHLWDV